MENVIRVGWNLQWEILSTKKYQLELKVSEVLKLLPNVIRNKCRTSSSSTSNTSNLFKSSHLVSLHVSLYPIMTTLHSKIHQRSSNSTSIRPSSSKIYSVYLAQPGCNRHHQASILEGGLSNLQPKRCTLPETNRYIAPENRPKPNRKQSYSNHPFSGANSKMLVSGRVTIHQLPNLSPASTFCPSCKKPQIIGHGFIPAADSPLSPVEIRQSYGASNPNPKHSMVYLPIHEWCFFHGKCI